MRAYAFSFFDSDGALEAGFALNFDNDKAAAECAKELLAHSHFSMIEVRRRGKVLLRLERRLAKAK